MRLGQGQEARGPQGGDKGKFRTTKGGRGGEVVFQTTFF